MLWRSFLRACWHGYSGGYGDWIALSFTDRWLCATELGRLIDKSNEQRGGGRPKDDR